MTAMLENLPINFLQFHVQYLLDYDIIQFANTVDYKIILLSHSVSFVT